MTLRKQLFLSASSNISKQDFLGFSIQSTLEYLINAHCAFIGYSIACGHFSLLELASPFYHQHVLFISQSDFLPMLGTT